MATISVYLEDGFEHDRVELSTATGERVEPDATTRYQIGLAAMLDLPAPDGGSCLLRVAVPGQGLLAEKAFDPGVEPHVRVSIRADELEVEPVAFPPMFA